MNLQRLAWKCTQEVLSALGEPTMQSLAWHTGRSGVSMAPDDFDIKKFHTSLYELMGEGADILVEQVARGMAEELKLPSDFGKDLTGIERVLKVLEIAGKVKG